MHTCTSLGSRFSSNAHHHGLLPQQRGVVWDLLLKADPEGPSLIYRAASHTVVSSTHCKPPSVLLQHTETQEVEGCRFSPRPFRLRESLAPKLHKTGLFRMEHQP